MSSSDSFSEDLLRRQGVSSLGISEQTKKEYEFVMGIDFGTTYSGVAYSRVGDVDGHGVPIIIEISKWPGRGSQITTQAPTRSVYKDGKFDKWGHQMPGPRQQGGGTVDLVVYRIHVEENGESTLIEEVAGDGEMCGSITLDVRFRAFVADKIQELTTLPPLTGAELDGIVSTFAEKLKFSIYDPSDLEYDADLIAIDLPNRYTGIVKGDDKVGIIEDCNLLVPPTEIINHVFDPVVMQVLDLVNSQFHKVDKELDAIFLVGGFGQSDYLFTKLKAKFYPEVRLVCTPSRGEMAIVRGAVLMGLNPRFVKQRVVRRTYGYECALEFEDGKDSEELKTRTMDGEEYCNKRFLQYALKGEIKDIDYYAETSFNSYYNGNPVLNLYAYDGDIDSIPRYTTDTLVKKIIDFQITLPELPDKRPDDVIEVNVKFYLYQTEIKLQVEIENVISVYTGSYRRASPKMLGTLTNETERLNISDTRFGTQNINPSYATTIEEMPEEDGFGIQGYILEPTVEL